MPRSIFRFLVIAAASLCAVAGVLAATPSSVSAHNTLVSSDPADGSTTEAPPAQITWVFDNDVPLETLTVTLIDASGARNDLAGSTHGQSGSTEVITPLPALQPGPVSLRWRLVGPDGHPITGRVDFTIASPPTTTSAAVAVSTSTPGDIDLAPTTTIAAPVLDVAGAGDDDGVYSTPSWMRWVLRYASYLSIMAVVGIVLTGAWIWDEAGRDRRLQRIVSRALVATAVLAVAQLLVVASDVSGRSPLSSFGAVDAATTTDAGMALAIRVALAAALWIVLFRYQRIDREVFWTAASMAGIGLLATWAFAGHSRSMRWPQVGVVADVAHHAAAATWITGLAVVAFVALPRSASVATLFRRFSRVAATCVVVLVVTGVVQSVRLVGSPLDLFEAEHGRLLAVKLVALAVMLVAADTNRRRVAARLDDAASFDRQVGPLRRAMLTEFVLGLVIVAITAAMVVSPPATAG